jgi:MFS family permease
VQPGTFRSALAYPELRWYLAHHAVAGTAQSLGIVAISVALFEQTDSTSWVAAAAVARLLPYLLLSGPAGVLADRTNLRRLLLRSSWMRTIALGALAFAVVAEAPPIVVVLLVFVATTIGIPCYPALAALIPSLVPAEELAPANGLLTTIETSSWMVGPAAGGLLLLWVSPAIGLAVNAGFFALGTLALVPTNASASEAVDRRRETAPEPFRTALTDGLRTVVGSAEVAVPLLLVVVVNVIFGGATVGLLLVAGDLLHTDRDGFGLLIAALGIGGFAGVALTNRIADSRRPDLGIMAATVLAGVPFAALAVVTSSWLAVALMVLAGAASIITEVVAMTVLLRSLPQEMIARVFGLTDSLLVGSILVGSLVAPALIAVTGLRTSLVIVGAVLPVTAVLGGRHWQRLADRATTSQVALAPRLDLLAAQPWLAYVLPTVLETLATHAIEEEVPAGTALIHQGDAPDDFYLILEGEFEVTQARAGRAVRSINRLGPGQGFGEIGLLGGVARTATVSAGRRRLQNVPAARLRTDCRRANSPAKVLRLPGDLFVAAVNSAPIAADGSVGAGLIARMAAGAVADGR